MTRFLALASALFVTAAVGQQLAIEPVVSGLSQPVAITHAGDGRLFITEQRGIVRVYDGTRLLSVPFLDIDSQVSCCGERGLLSVAFSPQYATNGFFYVNYTDNQGHTVVARYTRSSTDPNRADPSSARIVLTIAQPFSNHNGGQLQFGPDGYLYIGMGDGGSGNDPFNNGQKMNELLGKMLRIDVNNTQLYTIPPSNPFVNTPNVRPEIWASGMRNPWRFSFDRVTGDLWIGDVGQGQWEEVDFQPAASIGGENYGWRLMEGAHCFIPSTNCNPNGNLVFPVLEYHHTGACSVTGGYVYRGSRYPRLYGMYIFGDYCSGVVFGATRTASGGFTGRGLLVSNTVITTFGEDVNGELYLADYRGGVIYHIVDPVPLPPKRRSVR